MLMFSSVEYGDLPADKYHATPHYSVSQWKKLPGDPESFYGYHVARPALWLFETTPSMEFGSNAHSVLLEHCQWSCPPDEVLSKSGSRAGGAWKEYEATHSPLECLSQKEAKSLADLVRSAHSDPKIRWLLETEGHVEYSLFGTHTETGLPVRGRLDKWIETPEGRCIIDLKTISGDPTSGRAVSAQCYSLRYHLQAAAYLDLMEAAGLPCDAFFFIFAETKPPYRCCLWSLVANDIELGRRQNIIALRDLKRRLDSGDWHGERHGQLSIANLPSYAFDGDAFTESGIPYEEFAAYQ